MSGVVCAESAVPKIEQANTPRESRLNLPILLRMPESLAEIEFNPAEMQSDDGQYEVIPYRPSRFRLFRTPRSAKRTSPVRSRPKGKRFSRNRENGCISCCEKSSGKDGYANDRDEAGVRVDAGGTRFPGCDDSGGFGGRHLFFNGGGPGGDGEFADRGCSEPFTSDAR